ncbi:MAG: hypothetical protein WCX82_03970 [archaeon]|jgi:hypothetical protein
MNPKYNEVVVLVHPLYDLLKSDFAKRALKFKLNKSLPKEYSIEYLILHNEAKAFNYQLKHTLQAYGEEIKKYVNKPKTLVVMYPPHPSNLETYFKEQDSGDTREDLARRKKQFEALAGKFVNFSKTQLKERFVIDNISKASDIPRFPDTLVSNLDKNISLKLFGEYGDYCVIRWKTNLAADLEKKGFNVKSEIISEKTLYREESVLRRKGKLDLRVLPLSHGRLSTRTYRQDKREKGKLPLKPKKWVAK